MDTQTVAAPISATRQKYEMVNGTWPVPQKDLPVLDAVMAKKAFRALYRHRFHKKWTKPVEAVVGKHRRTWTRMGKMIVAPDAGWHHFIHDISHWAHRRQYPHQMPHKGSSHAAVERDLIEQVLKRGWLKETVKKPKPAPQQPQPELPTEKKEVARKPKLLDLREQRLAKVTAAIKRWETKARRADTALKKLRKQKRYYDKLVVFSLTD